MKPVDDWARQLADASLRAAKAKYPDMELPADMPPQVHVGVCRYVVSLVPLDHRRGREWDLYVEAHGDRWKVHRDLRPEMRLTVAGEWSFSGGPETLHDLDTAYRLAAAEAPRLIVSGMTAGEWLERRRSM